VPGMTCLRVIENVEPHVEDSVGDEVVIEFAASAQVAGDLKDPVPILPLRGSANIRSIALVISRNDDSWDDGADRDRGIMIA